MSLRSTSASSQAWPTSQRSASSRRRSASRACLATQAIVRRARCQTSWWSTSATEAPKRFWSCAFAERRCARFSFSECASGKCSSNVRMPTKPLLTCPFRPLETWPFRPWPFGTRPGTVPGHGGFGPGERVTEVCRFLHRRLRQTRRSRTAARARRRRLAGGGRRLRRLVEARPLDLARLVGLEHVAFLHVVEAVEEQ